MAVEASVYFHHLKSYLNTDYYGIRPNMHGELALEERITTPDGEIDQIVTLNVEGEAFAIKLDTTFPLTGRRPTRAQSAKPLFHFLNNEGRPWSRRCDFVVFNLQGNRIFIHCLEYKYRSLPVDSIMSQLTASENWCRALYATIKIYTGHTKKTKLSKYVLSCCSEERAHSFLDDENKYLSREPSIRHYFYNEIDQMNLHDLDHCAGQTIGQ